MIEAARAPILYFGGGIAIARAERALRDFAARTGIPSVATLKGLGGLPTDAPDFLGMLGMHGTRAANIAIDECDLLICVGARFDDRATGKLDTFAPDARVIHIDGDPAEIGKLRRARGRHRRRSDRDPRRADRAARRHRAAGRRAAPTEAAQWARALRRARAPASTRRLC